MRLTLRIILITSKALYRRYDIVSNRHRANLQVVRNRFDSHASGAELLFPVPIPFHSTDSLLLPDWAVFVSIWREYVYACESPSLKTTCIPVIETLHPIRQKISP